MNIHVCYSKIISYSFEYLKCWILTNIVYINHNTKFIWFLYKPMKIKFCMKCVWNYECVLQDYDVFENIMHN